MEEDISGQENQDDNIEINTEDLSSKVENVILDEHSAVDKSFQPDNIDEEMPNTGGFNGHISISHEIPSAVGGEVEHIDTLDSHMEECDDENVNTLVEVQSHIQQVIQVSHSDDKNDSLANANKSEDVSDEMVDNNGNEKQPSDVISSSLMKWNYSFLDIPLISQTDKIFGCEDYLNGCKWSPDGTCLLTSCIDFKLRLFELPQTFYNTKEWNTSNESSDLKVCLEMPEGGGIYDYDWYPFMSSWDPITCCFISSSCRAPIHLWDAFTGKIRATYRCYDYSDEVHSAIAISFSLNGENIYCGFQNKVTIFDTACPGRDCTFFDIKKIGQQKGIVSCIAENPSMPEIFALGTYSKSIGLYTRSKELICLLNGQKSGVTQLKFTADGMKLYTGARMNSEILCWDLRSPGRILHVIHRSVSTNQRIYFDLFDEDRYLISGGTDGNVKIWDLAEIVDEDMEKELILREKYVLKAHNDCVNGVSMNKKYPILATSSGQKHYPDIDSDEDSDYLFVNRIHERAENSVKLWWIGPRTTDEKYPGLDSNT